jgi:hypothetical protein
MPLAYLFSMHSETRLAWRTCGKTRKIRSKAEGSHIKPTNRPRELYTTISVVKNVFAQDSDTRKAELRNTGFPSLAMPLEYEVKLDLWLPSSGG